MGDTINKRARYEIESSPDQEELLVGFDINRTTGSTRLDRQSDLPFYIQAMETYNEHEKLSEEQAKISRRIIRTVRQIYLELIQMHKAFGEDVKEFLMPSAEELNEDKPSPKKSKDSKSNCTATTSSQNPASYRLRTLPKKDYTYKYDPKTGLPVNKKQARLEELTSRVVSPSVSPEKIHSKMRARKPRIGKEIAEETVRASQRSANKTPSEEKNVSNSERRDQVTPSAENKVSSWIDKMKIDDERVGSTQKSQTKGKPSTVKQERDVSMEEESVGEEHIKASNGQNESDQEEDNEDDEEDEGSDDDDANDDDDEVEEGEESEKGEDEEDEGSDFETEDPKKKNRRSW